MNPTMTDAATNATDATTDPAAGEDTALLAQDQPAELGGEPVAIEASEPSSVDESAQRDPVERPAASVPRASDAVEVAGPPHRRGFASSFAIGFLIVLLGFGGGLLGWYVGDRHLADDSGTSGDGAVFQPTNDRPAARAKSTRDASPLPTPREVYADVPDRAAALADLARRVSRDEVEVVG